MPCWLLNLAFGECMRSVHVVCPPRAMCCLAGLQTGKAHTSHANMMMATAAAIMLLAAAVTYELPHLVS